MIEEILERSNLRWAFGRVEENHGCRGADGMTVSQFAADLEWDRPASGSPFMSSLSAISSLQIAVPKKSGGKRLLRIPTVRDRVVQTAVDLVVRPIFEAEFEDCSYAFREGRSVRDAVRRSAARDQGFRCLLDADIDDCFGSIPYERLLDRLRRLELDDYVLRLFESWVRARFTMGSACSCRSAAFLRARWSHRCSPISSSTTWMRASSCSSR